MANELMMEMLLYLLNNGKTNTKTLAHHFDVSTKTIYRYGQKLSIAGVPIFSSSGRDGGLEILSTFKLDKCYLTKNERGLVTSFLDELPLSNLQKDNLHQKLIPDVEISSELVPSLLIDNSVWQSNRKTCIIPDIILNAIHAKTSLCIIYKGEERIIFPYTILYKSCNYYLVAYCTKRKDIRLFKIDRIEEVTTSNEEYKELALTRSELTKKIQSSFERVEITLATRTERDNIIKNFEVINLENKKDESIIKINALKTSDLATSLLAYQDKIKILSPTWLKDEILNICSNIKNSYAL